MRTSVTHLDVAVFDWLRGHLISCGLKTETSAAAVPVSPEVRDALACWARGDAVQVTLDQVFPGPTMGGKKPYWQDSLKQSNLARLRARI